MYLNKGAVNAPFKPPRMAGRSSGLEPGRQLKRPRVQPVAEQLPVSTQPVHASGTRVFNVLYRKKTGKKNKTWDGDGTLSVSGKNMTLKGDFSGAKEIASGTGVISMESVFSLGSYEIEIEGEISGKGEAPSDVTMERVVRRPVAMSLKPLVRQFKPVVASQPLKSKKDPLHDPLREGALVMKRPETGASLTDVVVDPILCDHLRPHQREGVQFLYECLMDMKGAGDTGALLADEMGLGKTLMTITTIWTLLRQTAYADKSPPVRKVLIVCPVTLIGNWQREFKKWLGRNRISVLAIKGNQSTAKEKQDVVNFGRTRVYQVMIIGYEKLLTLANEVETINFDLLVCDEGHRLKSGQNKALKFLQSMSIERRIVLTGTPIQNDLQEFFNIINFVNPGILGTFGAFQKKFMRPILRAREVNCTNRSVIKRGDEVSRELIDITKTFMLRRTSDILTNYLPPRRDFVLFAPPTKFQLQLCDMVMGTKNYERLMKQNNANESLGLISLFRKICSSPSLLKGDSMLRSLFEGSEIENGLARKSASGKIIILTELLNQIKSATDDKIVVVSNYTQTLDVIQDLLPGLRLSYSRLDGSTPAKLRDKVVSDFNNSSTSSCAILLLSAKAGGVGLNLIGANRLILFDNDWNPSVDLQAMARVHRDGQKKPVYVYRLLTTGCLDEKIFQRQMMKLNLSSKFLDANNDSNDDVFDYSDLKDLFTIQRDINSNTHSLMECNCSGIGEELVIDQESESEEEDDSSNGWISAFDFKQLSQEPTKKRNAIKKCMAEFRHVNPMAVDDEFESGDTVIDSLLKQTRENASLMTFMFMKLSAG
ncbi:unnamed protein product [Kuraishia capsulata CBS 1993]|uniref:DNA repair and recombination protein RDH54 n=1 Tax=Kuraishia capsulata CBS 1993 TaxID=1382522 RepID=W6MVR3_9ASCO|nr:uncharacterized protein KUCA_T00002407001 [Kuraishia capsulata CBS 1993]CDK26435.1 unnamed protein product [Kuraishia capsulata CBS 1993]